MRRAVAAVERQVLALVADAVAVERVAPAQRPDQVPGVGVEQQLVRVEAVPFFRPVRPVHAVTVEQPGPRLGQVAVPDAVGALAQRDALDLAPAAGVEQAELDLLGVRRKKARS